MIAQSTQDHTRIVEAICAGDPDRAADAMKLHLAHIEACCKSADQPPTFSIKQLGPHDRTVRFRASALARFFDATVPARHRPSSKVM
ncbi:MAG: FCD domain-containing protein [Alphaproteobacteria bacterium]|nr:MAG: FCD domain-containing protein [Alphaproteobacteria bacterium]